MQFTTESFINAAKAIHGDKYDYRNVVYKNIKTKVCIICPKHGQFEQTPDKHLHDKCGCPFCAGNRRGTTESFIERAKSVHGDSYDYSKVVYLNNRTPVEIICKEHGSFWQLPSNHLAGKGCRYCANNVCLSTEQFVEKARTVHGDKYDYTDTVYCGNRKPVSIRCFEHGVFTQIPYVHLQGSGCPVCGMNDTHLHRDAVLAHEKAVQTLLSRYGVANPMDLSMVRMKQLAAVQSSEVNRKRIATKRRNQSFNTSLVEYRLGELLKKQFGSDDVFNNYVSDVYPYKCDYYIKSRDMYIELNAHWSHGGHWYNPDKDFDIISDWLGKSEFYKNAVKTFSERDVEKRNVARMNNLNYVVFWKSDLSDAKEWFLLGCPDGCDWQKEYFWLL